VHEQSNPELIGYKRDTMQYRWKFKIEENFEFSQSLTHFFQIKAKNVSERTNRNGGDTIPILTLTVFEKSDDLNELQLRHSSGNEGETESLIQENFSLIAGKWVEFFVQITYHDKGSLKFQVKDVESRQQLVNFEKDKLDLWRGENRRDFAYPAWGIYRSLNDQENFSAENQLTRFADFSLSKGKLK